MQRRPYAAVSWLVIVLVASLVACVPGAIWAVGITVAVFVADVAVHALERTTRACDDQLLSLFARGPVRGPPLHASLV